MSDTRNSALMDAISKTLEGLGPEITGRERQEYDYWDFGHLMDGQAGWFIAGKIREALGQRPRIASEEQARRDGLSARVMSGELDDVNLYVRKTSRDGLSPATDMLMRAQRRGDAAHPLDASI